MINKRKKTTTSNIFCFFQKKKIIIQTRNLAKHWFGNFGRSKYGLFFYK